MLKAAIIIAIVGVAIQMSMSFLFIVRIEAVQRLFYLGDIRLYNLLSFISHGAMLFFFITFLIKQK